MNETNLPSETSFLAAKRVLAGIAALLLTAFALMAMVNQLRTTIDPLGSILGLSTAAAAALCWWFALRGHILASRGRIRLTVKGGLIVGGIGFVIGFVGPVLFAPDANQGPLLGIFITGPLGFVAGSVLGWLYARSRICPTE